jgi:tetratricopeptide (TPR) repeat protein
MKWLWLTIAGFSIFLLAAYVGAHFGRVSDSPVMEEQRQQQFIRRVRQLVELQRYSDAIQLLSQVPDDSPLAPECRLREGQIYRALGRWNKAEKAWLRALKIQKDYPEVGWYLLDLYYMEERFEEAKKLALELFEAEPEPRDRVLWLLELIRQEHERVAPAELIRVLWPVIQWEPDNLYANRLIGRCYLTLGRVSEGLEHLEKALQLAPQDLETWYYLISRLYELGDLARLAELWPEVPADAWKQARFHRYKGMWAEGMGRTEEALQSYRKALELDSYDRKAHYQYGQLLGRLGIEPEKAEFHRRRSEAIDKARVRLGELYLQALQVKHDPTPEACLQIADCWETMGEVAQAQAWRKEAEFRKARSMGTPFRATPENAPQPTRIGDPTSPGALLPERPSNGLPRFPENRAPNGRGGL